MQESQETWVRSLGREDPLEEAMATHSSILAWRIPWTETPVHRVSKGQTQLKRLSTHACWSLWGKCLMNWWSSPVSLPGWCWDPGEAPTLFWGREVLTVFNHLVLVGLQGGTLFCKATLTGLSSLVSVSMGRAPPGPLATLAGSLLPLPSGRLLISSPAWAPQHCCPTTQVGTEVVLGVRSL